MPKSKIPWCGETWNPAEGCWPCSPGCENCWAKGIVWRLAHNPKTSKTFRGLVVKNKDGKLSWTGKILRRPELYDVPKARKKPTVFFVCSRTDLFLRCYFNFINDIYRVMADCPQHTFIILTKHPEEMAAYWRAKKQKILPNVFHYVTICNQAEADEKIPQFLEIDCGFHGINIEPMLGPVDLRPWIADVDDVIVDSESGGWRRVFDIDLRPWTPAIDHVIVGCESGKHRRPCDIEWISAVVAQCVSLGIPVYVKQISDDVGQVVTNPKDYPEYWIGHRVLPWKVQR